MTCHIKGNTITCYRGQDRLFSGQVKDRQGNIWFVKITEEQFNYRKEIEVFSEDGKIRKRYMKKFLTWIKKIDEKLCLIKQPAGLGDIFFC
jgi:hypothetical protein